jgi:hypothetical protein
MKKTTKLEIKDMLLKIDKSKKIIALERDKLRSIFEDLESVIESCDTGIENIEEGMCVIEHGIDDLSQYL